MLSRDDKVIIKRFWRDWVVCYKQRLVLVFLLMVLVAATGGAYPALIRHVFAVLAAGPERNAAADALINLDDPFVLIPLAIICLASVKGVAMYFQVLSVNSLALKVTTDIQKAMAHRLIDADLATVMAEPAGAFVSRIMNDLNLVREAFVRLANNLVRDVLTIFVMVGVMFWFSWLLSVLVLAVYPLAMRPIIQIGNRQRKASGALQEHMETVTSLLAEILQGVRMVKAYQLEAAEKTRSARAFDGLYERLVNLLAGRARIDPVLEVLGGFAVAGVIGVAAWQVSNGQLQVGDVVGFITALLLLVQPVRAIGTLNAITQEGLAATARVFALLDQRAHIIDPPQPARLQNIKGELCFKKVSFAYQDAAILDDISFTVAPGQTVALVGPSGSGKSTIINLLPRFYDPSGGQITIDGVSISQFSLSDLRDHIALVSQEAVLFDDTVAANIGFGRQRATDKDIRIAAKSAAADEFIDQLPDTYATAVGAGGNKLSGGQRQRIAIARAMLKDAPILLLDEATSALDAQSEQLVQEALDRLSSGRTTLVVAHRLSTIQKADLIIVLDKGRIAETGTHQTLLNKDGLYAHLCALQSFS